MEDKQIIDIARIRLPLIIEIFTAANLEAQSKKPDLDKLEELLLHDKVDGFYDLFDLLTARSTNKRIVEEFKKEVKK